MNPAKQAKDEFENACGNAPPYERILSGAEFIRAVRKALGIKVLGQRVIIDAKCDGHVTVYFQGIGDDRLLSLDLESLLKNAEPIFLPVPKQT